MLVGYARTSTTDQVAGFEGQKAQLMAAGCEKLFAEQVSATAHRAELKTALAFMREGDALVVTKADRLARSTAELLRIVEDLNQRGIGLRILSMNGMELDTRQATSKLMLTILGAVAEFERSLMLERQREGIAKAKAEKRYKGRAPTARNQLAQMQELKAAGLGATAIARQLGVNRSSVYRLLGTVGVAR